MWDYEIAQLLHRIVIDKLVSATAVSPEDEGDMSETASEWQSAVASHFVGHLLLEYFVADG